MKRLLRLPIRRRDLLGKELDEEVRLHLELRADQLVKEGMSSEAAWAEACRRFGVSGEGRRQLEAAARRRNDRLHLREQLGSIARDLQYAGRVFKRHPFYAIGVIGTIGVGMGAALVVWTLAWNVWLAPMPYPNPDRVLRLYEMAPSGPEASAADESRRQRLTPALIRALQESDLTTVDAVSELWPGAPIGGDGMAAFEDPTTITAATLSPEGFGILGIRPSLGRLPVNTESELLLSEDYWRSEMGSDPEVLNRILQLHSYRPPAQIVGVARVPTSVLRDPDVIRVYAEPANDATIRFVSAIARLRPGFTPEEAEAELQAFVAGFAEIHPQYEGWSIEAPVLADDLVRPFRSVLVLLLGAAVTFLVLAAVNVVGLVAARRLDRQHDETIRLAIGASEGRIFRGALIESLFLSLVGTAGAVVVTYWVVTPTRAIVPFDVPRLSNVTVTPAMALAGIGSGVALGLIIGVAGYLITRGSRPSIGRAMLTRGTGSRGRRLVVVGQVALTTLFAAAVVGILHRVTTLRAIDLGFRPEGLSVASLRGAPDHRSSEEAAAYWASVWRPLLEGMESRGVPTALAFNPPMSGEDEAQGVTTLPIRPDGASDDVMYRTHVVSPGYFSVMGIELLAGRPFAHTDDSSGEKVVIVSEAFARAYLPPGSAVESILGRTLESPLTVRGPATVIGAVGATRHIGPDTPIEPELYVLYDQQPTIAPSGIVFRADTGRAAELLPVMLNRFDSNLEHSPVASYMTYLDDWYAPLRLQLIAIGVLGALGLLLASLGIYSLMAYQVATRRKELGIRKALGSPDDRLMWGVLGSSASMTLVGTIIGLAAWYQLLPWTSALVEGIDLAGATLPLTVAAVIGISSLLATLAPARHAARVDPAVTLRLD
ncbi:MAG: FtsX-like permease family protein [Gemmatimonas sp.]|nr:FtsX-like permease family protein [Gemmatimonas sp.]